MDYFVALDGLDSTLYGLYTQRRHRSLCPSLIPHSCIHAHAFFASHTHHTHHHYHTRSVPPKRRRTPRTHTTIQGYTYNKPSMDLFLFDQFIICNSHHHHRRLSFIGSLVHWVFGLGWYVGTYPWLSIY